MVAHAKRVVPSSILDFGGGLNSQEFQELLPSSLLPSNDWIWGSSRGGLSCAPLYSA